MEIILIRVLQFVLAITILVIFHEGGHFFFSKLFGIRVEKFYVFFDPWFHIFEFKPKNSETAYGLGWLPLGGYCKIAGMIDESFDTEQMKQEPQPWEFRTKPAWQRLLVMIGGVLVNLLLALFIYSMILFHWGETYTPVKNMTYGFKFSEQAKEIGFQDRDILVATDKGELKEFDGDMFRELSTARKAYVIRNGEPVTIDMPGDLNLLHMIKEQPMFVEPFIPLSIDSVLPGTPAAETGMEKGDHIVAINGREVDSYNEYSYEIARLSDLLAVAESTADSINARTTTIVIKKQDESRDTCVVTLDSELKLGYMNTNVFAEYKSVTTKYGLLESFPAGVKYGWHVIVSYVDDMKYVFSAEGVKSLGGFGTIGSLFPSVWDWYLFWKMTAFLSIILAVMNILPIPALDGGHVLFLLYEIITRRKPSEKFMIWAEYIGFALILMLLIVANLNDVLRLIGYM